MAVRTTAKAGAAAKLAPGALSASACPLAHAKSPVLPRNSSMKTVRRSTIARMRSSRVFWP